VKDIFWIEGDTSIGLAIVTRPRGGDWLEDELRRMQRNGIQVLVSMLEDEEAESLGLAEERLLAEQNGLAFLSYPIADRTTPGDVSSFRGFAEDLASRGRTHRRPLPGQHWARQHCDSFCADSPGMVCGKSTGGG
jgi:hypothetical protein